MRQKMRQQLDKSSAERFDLKQGEGGITDIEFMVQYAVLAWSAGLPDLMVYTDNIRILDALVATGKLTQQEGSMLADAYRFYRAKQITVSYRNNWQWCRSPAWWIFNHR